MDTNAIRTLSQPSMEKYYAYSIMKLPHKYIYILYKPDIHDVCTRTGQLVKILVGKSMTIQ